VKPIAVPISCLFLCLAYASADQIVGDREANKTVVRRFFEEVQNKDQVDLVDSIYAEGATQNGKPFDREQFKARRRSGASAFENFFITVHELIGDDDVVIARTSATAKSVGSWIGFPPTNKEIHMWAIDYFRFSSGKIVEHWHIADRLGTIVEMGYLPLKGNGFDQFERLRRVNDYRHAARSNDSLALRSLLAREARLWFETLEGPGMLIRHTGKGPWAEWDEFFGAQSVVLRHEIDDSSVTVVSNEMNEFYRLIHRPPTPVNIRYIFDGDLKICKILISRAAKPIDKMDEFKRWMKAKYPEMVRYLLPDGEIVPSLDRARKWKELLLEWRQSSE